MGKDNFQNFWSMKGKNAEFPTSTLSFPRPLLCMPSYPQTLTHRTPPQWKLMAKLGALNIINWGKCLTSLLKVCARFSYLENYTDKLKIKPQPFCTQKSKVIFSSQLTPLIYYRLFPQLKLLCQQRFTFWENTHRMITLEQIQDIWKQELVWDQLLYRCPSMEGED